MPLTVPSWGAVQPLCTYTTTVSSTNFLLLFNAVAAQNKASCYVACNGLGCCRSASTARSVAQDAHGRARDFGDSAGQTAAEARDSAEQTGRDTARKGGQGTRWAAEELHDSASNVGQSVGQLLCFQVLVTLRLPFAFQSHSVPILGMLLESSLQ